MSTKFALPAVMDSKDGFLRYLQEIRKFPSLTADEEYMLAKRFEEHQDVSAAHKLVTSHLKLVAKIATSFRGYGLPLVELVSEGNIGLMQAVKRFKSDLGYRLSTYAVWWIKASIQEYILRSWSLVKMGTTAAQKKLFFNLNKIKKKLYNGENRNLAPEDCETIANELNVTNKEVQEMEMRLVGADLSLNKSLSDESGDEIIDLLPETRANQETMMARSQEMQQRKSLLNSAMATLNEREKHIFSERRLKEEPTTLEILSQTLGISRERVRQIEARVFEKLQNAMVNAS